MRKTSVLIIQHGHGQHRLPDGSEWIHYSDIFRSTCLLEQFRGSHVSWITDMAAADLFLDNHLIDELILADHPVQLSPESVRHYDVVINLERELLWCKFAAQIPASHRYGFLLEDASKSADEGNRLGADPKRGGCTFQDSLYQLIGRQWLGQHYVLGYQARSKIIHGVGFNRFVAPGLTEDVWAPKSWQLLYRRLQDDYDVSWPKAIDGIREYVEWLASCQVIVTGENLGLHLALAMKKKVVVLLDRKDRSQVYLYGHGIKLSPFSDWDDHRLANGPPSTKETIPVDGVADAIAAQLDDLAAAKDILPAFRKNLPVGAIFPAEVPEQRVFRQNQF